MITSADIIVDLQAGDTGKGKVAHHLAGTHPYTAVIRYNGGSNAGHTMYQHGVKIVTHQVPVGILHNIPSIIGPGCVVNVPLLEQELEMLRHHGYVAPIYIDRRCHVTTSHHLEEDARDVTIGTTKQGIGPTYRDKYFRTGCRIDTLNVSSSSYTIIDIYDFLYDRNTQHRVLLEGAQGFQIDIDWGDYPYVTSSHCTVGSVALNGIAPRYWRNIYGTMKAYETYSGYKTHYTDPAYADIFEKIQEVGQEYGATTGRKRQVRWVNLTEVVQALYINNVTDIIISKSDVLAQIGTFGVKHDGVVHLFTQERHFRNFVEAILREEYREKFTLTWSTSPEHI